MRKLAAGFIAGYLVAFALVISARQATQPIIESSPSLPIRVSHIVLKWDARTATLAEAQALKWAAHVDGTRVELPEAVCGPPTGKTPVSEFSCELPIRPDWLGKDVSVSAWLPAPAMPVPGAVRVFPQLVPEK